jgi:hypothetical protein
MKKVIDPVRMKMWADLWGQRRAKGRAHYIFFNIVLKIGSVCGGIATFFHLGLVSEFNGNINPLWKWPIEFVVLMLVFGIGYGFVFWHLNEKEYQKWLKENNRG